MATRYPLSIEEMKNVVGVSEGKARKYGAEFLSAIKQYVEENEIERPVDFVMKTMVRKSQSKVTIIKSIDKKIPLDLIAKTLEISKDDLLDEMDMIVSSGTRINIDYYIEEKVDESVIEIIEEYFMEASSDSINEAYKILKEEDITLYEIQLVRLKFLSDVGN